MALYKYRAVNAQGTFTKGYVAGRNSQDALRTLSTYPISLLSLRRCLFFFYNAKSLLLFFLYLEYALKAGYTLVPALNMIKSSFKGTFRDLLQSIQEKLAQGHLLSDVCQDYPKIFTPPLIALIRIGEQSGQFIHICRQSYIYLSQCNDQRTNLFKTLAYPCVNFFAFCIALTVLISVTLPDVLSLLKENHKEMPMATYILFCLSQCAWEYILLGGCIIGILIFGIRYGRDFIIFSIFGFLSAPIQYAKIFSALNLLMQEKIPFIPALSIVCHGISSPHLKKHFNRLLQEVQEGKKFYQALSQLPYFSFFYIQLIQAGETTGSQQESMMITTQLMLSETRHFVEKILFWISPIFMVFIGLLFGVLIEGTFIPLYDNVGSSSYAI